MNAFQFHLPTRILFGSDTIAQVGEAVKAAGGSRVLVLYGTGSVQRNGVLDKVLTSLGKQGLSYSVEGGIQPNPRLAKAQALADTYAGKGIDFLLGVGGASVLTPARRWPSAWPAAVPSGTTFARCAPSPAPCL